jgi:two-component system, LytTR family, response regulator
MLKVIIIDDESHCADSLAAMLKSLFANSIVLLGVYFNADDGKAAIEKLSPDLVFLDVKMPNKTGIDMLYELNKISFELIFTTAHEEYAMRAIKFNALDYLLKPFGTEELREAIEKCIEKKRQRQEMGGLDMNIFLQNLKTVLPENKRLTIPTGKGVQFVEIKNIVRIEALNNYCQFYFIDKTKLVVSKTLKEYEDLLTEYKFFRIHNSHLVNLSHVRSILSGEGDTAVMSDDSKVEISRRKKPELMEAIKLL